MAALSVAVVMDLLALASRYGDAVGFSDSVAAAVRQFKTSMVGQAEQRVLGQLGPRAEAMRGTKDWENAQAHVEPAAAAVANEDLAGGEPLPGG